MGKIVPKQLKWHFSAIEQMTFLSLRTLCSAAGDAEAPAIQVLPESRLPAPGPSSQARNISKLGSAVKKMSSDLKSAWSLQPRRHRLGTGPQAVSDGEGGASSVRTAARGARTSA